MLYQYKLKIYLISLFISLLIININNAIQPIPFPNAVWAGYVALNSKYNFTSINGSWIVEVAPKYIDPTYGSQ